MSNLKMNFILISDVSRSKPSLEPNAILHLYIYLARTPEIGQGLGRILSCGARKPEQTFAPSFTKR